MNKGQFQTMIIPPEVLRTTETLKKAGFEAFLVGGCVRDIFRSKTPKDWDVTTNATPEQIIPLFDKTFYENSFGTVGVVVGETEEIIEVTPYRLESIYSDGRHPDQVTFSKNILDDLKRRDFTINAIAYDPSNGQIIDPYKGQEDIVAGIIRAVGDAGERFSEDGLRIMRAIRLAAELGFTINTDTEKAILIHKNMLSKVAKERIRDEFNKLMMSKSPMVAIVMAQRMGILPFIIPELEEGLHMKQNQAHAYDVFEHLVRSLQHAADKGWALEIRLSALLHDIGKPKTSRFSPEKGDVTFYGHEVVGAKMTKKILENLKYPKKTIELVAKLVRWHMFFSDTEQISLSAVRRMIVNVGRENIWDLMNLRICDRIGTGRPKENPYRLRKYKAMLEEAMRDPVSVGMLKVDGKTLMETLHVEPGPRIGYILHALLEEVLEDPKLNTEGNLKELALDLNKLSDTELKKKSEAGKQAKDEQEETEIQLIKQKHNVK
ncbi:MAG: HD domain-containing protein [Patescibacteria group bacterium]